MQRWVGHFLKAQCCDMWRQEQGFKITLHIKEIDVARRATPLLGERTAVGQTGQTPGLLETRDRRSALPAAVSRKKQRPISKTRTRPCVRLEVGAEVGNQPTEQVGAHHAHLAGNRVGQTDGRGVGREIGFPGVFNESVIDDFQKAASSAPGGAVP